MHDRIPCINPNCKRTAPADKYVDAEQIICGKCWKLLPGEIRNRYKRLAARRRKLIRYYAKRGVENPELRILNKLQNTNWLDIWNYFNKPQKPAGIETFLEEVGL